MTDPNRSPNSDNEKRKTEETGKENEKETETESEMHLDPPPATHGAPMDVDRTGSFIDVSDEDNDSNFGGEYDLAEAEENLIHLDADDEPANTTGTNLPHFPSAPVIPPTQARAGTIIRHSLVPPSSTNTIPPTQARGSNGTVTPHSLVPPSSTTTIPPTQTRNSAGSNIPHPLAPNPIFPVPSTQTRSSTGTDISRPFAPPTFATIAALPQTKDLGPPSPQLSSTARGVPHWQMGLMSSEPPGPPPVYTPRAQPLCVICNERPAYNDGRRAFPTCGNTCKRALEAAKLEATKKTTSSARSGNYSYSSGGSNGYHPSTTSPYQTRQTPIRMCDVCHVRPKYQKNGKIFPTCGLTCAAKLQPPGSVEMCEFCGERPKAVQNGQKFPHCGTTCRDKAKIADLASANAATCKTCLICWQAKIGDQGGFCSDECTEVADKKAPFLLEVPRGHVDFKKVSDFYTSEWKNPRTPCPGIKKVYMIVLKPDFGPKYEDYRRKVPSRPSFKRKGNEKPAWLELRRDCGFGDAGNTDPCSNKKCILCSLVRSSVSQEAAQQGIICTPSLARAIEFSEQNRSKRTSKVVVLANVLFGRKTEITRAEFEFVGQMPPPGYESVHLVRYGILGGKTDNEESYVFNGDAVKPLYLITHE